MSLRDDTLLAALAPFIPREDLVRFLGTFGGHRVFVPTLRSFLRVERERAVLEGWRDGDGYEELAARHGICSRTVRRIVGRGRPNTP